MKILLMVAMIVTAGQAHAGDLKGVLRNNQGVKKFGANAQVEAFDDFTGALSEVPFAGEVHYNIGNSFLHKGDFGKAISEYDQAIRNSSGSTGRELGIRFRSLFNSGIAATEEKDYDRALMFYQQALDIVPDSVETKTNIELLTQLASGGGGEGQDDSKGGEGNQEQKQDPKDDKGKDKDKEKDKDKDKNKENQSQNPKPTPRQFPQGKELSEQDVKRILEELKRQEEQIRANMQQKEMKDAPPDKDW